MYLSRSLLMIALALLPGLAAAGGQVPFGDRIDGRILNYDRLRTDVATSGRIEEGGVDLLTAQGFTQVIDLRTPREGVEAERVEVERAGMKYVNIPVGADLPDAAALARFREIVEDGSRGPLLVHCASGNRVGTLWTLYQIGRQVPVEEAIAQGRAIGMKASKEKQIRDTLQH